MRLRPAAMRSRQQQADVLETSEPPSLIGWTILQKRFGWIMAESPAGPRAGGRQGSEPARFSALAWSTWVGTSPRYRRRPPPVTRLPRRRV